ncbi:MAG: 4Fe-4S binding protein [Planctomycetota bacterium]
MEKSDTFNIQPYRRAIQIGFAGVCVLIGIQFNVFVRHLEQGVIPAVSRPPGVEAFLPISALISLKYWLLTGVFNKVHPSGLVLLLIIITTGLFLKRGFCSWVCPVGLLSEYLAKVHGLVFRKPLSLPRWLDYSLRGVKYFILLFFLWSIMVQMNVGYLERFIYGAYNKVADIKMLKFFTQISATAVLVIAGLAILSVLMRSFWCRYLCPYGALLGALSWLSPLKIRRNKDTCIDCRKCTGVCPAQVQVHKETAVLSDECNACLQCVNACPVKDTLHLSGGRNRKALSGPAYAAVIVLLFLAGTTLARLAGVWQNNISVDEYRELVQDAAKTGHPYYVE